MNVEDYIESQAGSKTLDALTVLEFESAAEALVACFWDENEQRVYPMYANWPGLTELVFAAHKTLRIEVSVPEGDV